MNKRSKDSILLGAKLLKTATYEGRRASIEKLLKHKPSTTLEEANQVMDELLQLHLLGPGFVGSRYDN